MAESPIERYLTDLAEIHGTRSNVPETSYYPALERLLTDIGRTLSSKVRCVIHPASRGAGLPDGGLFTADQFRRAAREVDASTDPFQGQNPSRGVIEAKAPSDDIDQIVESEQVGKYWAKYGMVLVTNFRAFALVGKGPSGRPRVLESFSLADSEAEFWRLASHPRKTAGERGERMIEYLRRVMLHNAPLTEPKEVAALLASYAHDARLRIETAELPALTGLRQALEDVLGLRFEGHKGDHFFRSTLVQTLFYGVFSAWVLWARRHDAEAQDVPGFAKALRESAAGYDVSGPFDWRSAHWLLRVPMLRALFVQVADPERLGALGLVEALDWTAAALNRVDRPAFFQSFDMGHAVQYFYEPFLQAFDPELRKELGVWYTPEEIVRYQVERVDAVLRSQLGLADGLADPKVVVLDPCCGTGAYLREVLRRIAATLHDKGGDALVAHDLKRAAMDRVFGFEILPAPFVISHLQLGLELETLGAPLSDRLDPPERVGVYLTNALTGWQPPTERPKQIAFAGFEEERDAAARVKQEKPILVILGNPPYNGFAGVAVAEESDLSNAYRTTKKAPAPQGQGLNDLYVRFFRMAERCITDRGRGVVCFISNYSWLDGLSFTGMRECFLETFDGIWIDNLHGDRIISEYAPDGRTSETVFAIGGQSPGIKVGTAISVLVKRSKDGAKLLYRDMHQARADERRAALLAGDGAYQQLAPALTLGLPFKPRATGKAYLSWPLLPNLLPSSFSGVKTARDGSLVAIDEAQLRQRIATYFSPSISDVEASRIAPELMDGDVRFDPAATRAYLVRRGIRADGFMRYYYRPFDLRWLYWESETKLLDAKRAEYLPHVAADNPCMVLAQRTRKGFCPPVITSRVVCYHVIESMSLAYPLYLQTAAAATLLEPAGRKANLSRDAAHYLAELQADAQDLFYHVAAVLHAPCYRTENSGALLQDWPRIPLPTAKTVLQASAAQGCRVAALLDTETPVSGVTAGTIRDDLRRVALFQRLDGKPARPEAGDLDLTAGWGHAGKGGVTMPGRGKIAERDDGAYDIFLNDVACWCNVPRTVWEYTIGGYQVIKKWLSYREKELLGRGLTPDEARYVTEMVRRIAALVGMGEELDDNYRAVAGDTWPWGNPTAGR